MTPNGIKKTKNTQLAWVSANQPNDSQPPKNGRFLHENAHYFGRN
jgi:hypothetical protein